MTATSLERRLFLALAWGKWLAREMEQAGQSMERCKMLRAQDGFGQGNGNWGVLVQDDPWALQFQRLDFRVARAKRAVGAQGVISIHRYGQETVSWPKGSPEIVEYNRENFQSNQRARAFKACQLLADKRHPAKVVDEEWDNRNPPENEYNFGAGFL